jgi:hypothetical protein
MKTYSAELLADHADYSRTHGSTHSLFAEQLAKLLPIVDASAGPTADALREARTCRLALTVSNFFAIRPFVGKMPHLHIHLIVHI